jgi:transposase InsO family protein
VPVLDRCSRKITGRYFGPEATSASDQTAWGKPLANEGVLAGGTDPPDAHSDRGTQMTSRSTASFFADLGIAQTFSRPRTPTDNATCESWMATLKCERLYEADTAELTPDEVEAMIDRFIDHYGCTRLRRDLAWSRRWRRWTSIPVSTTTEWKEYGALAKPRWQTKDED